MPSPISLRNLIKRFRALGWEGPFSGGKHQFMAKGALKIRIPNPHRGDVDWSLMKRILAQAGITHEQWESAD